MRGPIVSSILRDAHFGDALEASRVVYIYKSSSVEDKAQILGEIAVNKSMDLRRDAVAASVCFGVALVIHSRGGDGLALAKIAFTGLGVVFTVSMARGHAFYRAIEKGCGKD